MFNFDVNGLVDQIKPAIGKVAESLGTSGDQLLKIGIKGQLAEGVGYTVIGIIILAIFIVINVTAYKGAKEENDDKVFVCIFLNIFVFSFLIWMIWESCIHLVAPEYALMLEVKDLITGSR